MKKILSLLCLLVLGTGLAQAQGIRFESGSFKQILEKAKKENKCVFVDVYAVWCGPCKLMSNTVFKEKAVGDYANAHFVSVQIDCERGEGPSVKTRYAVEGLPGFLFLDPEGNVVYRMTGSMSAEKFIDGMKKAYEYSKDMNSVGRLAARYDKEKGDEKFVRTYLDKLKESGSAGYYDVVEHYLNMQTTMADTSKAMVDFLYAHIHSLTYGGKADRIVKANYGSEQWDLYVRKDVREAFQDLPKLMAGQTLEYAVMKKDSTLLDVALKRAVEEGMEFPSLEEQRERLLIYFYLHTEQGTKYKAWVAPKIDSLYNSLDVAHLRVKHKEFVEKMAENPQRRGRSFAMKYSEELRYRLLDYAKFVSTGQDKANMLKWAQRAYDLLPEDAANAAFHAKVLYLYGDKAQGVALMARAVEAGKDSKNAEGLAQDYAAMKAGQVVSL